MVPEYLTPQNGGLLAPGQVIGLSAAAFGLYGGPDVAELVLQLTPDVMVGKVQPRAARPWRARAVQTLCSEDPGSLSSVTQAAMFRRALCCALCAASGALPHARRC
jgi:hypothetical protein